MDDFDAWQNDATYRRALNGFYAATKNGCDPATLERFIAKYPKWEKELRKYDKELEHHRGRLAIEKYWRELGASRMTAAALANGGIATLEQIATRTHTELSAMRGVGNTSLRTIRAELAKRGLSWLGSPPPSLKSTEDNRTMAELALSALQVQDACNLSGVVHSFSAVLKQLWALLDSEGKAATTDINEHPISKLYADKIASLAGVQNVSMTEYAKAYDACTKLSEEG
jgi:hypothetical protein